MLRGMRRSSGLAAGDGSSGRAARLAQVDEHAVAVDGFFIAHPNSSSVTPSLSETAPQLGDAVGDRGEPPPGRRLALFEDTVAGLPASSRFLSVRLIAARRLSPVRAVTAHLCVQCPLRGVYGKRLFRFNYRHVPSRSFPAAPTTFVRPEAVPSCIISSSPRLWRAGPFEPMGRPSARAKPRTDHFVVMVDRRDDG